MKAGLILTLVFAVVATSASAQIAQKSKSVTQDEVPVAIVRSLQKDFNVVDKGNWRVEYQENKRDATFAAQFYVFVGKSDGKKIVIYYNPDATISRAKGVTIPDGLASKK